MPFIVVAHQDGGCDYTIACGTAVFPLVAKTMEQAMNEVSHMFFNDEGDHYGYADDGLSSLKIYEITNICEIDVKSIIKNLKDNKRAEEKKRQEEIEKREFERLNKKYGKNLQT